MTTFAYLCFALAYAAAAVHARNTLPPPPGGAA